MALPYYDMADIILRPRLADPVIASSDEIQQAIDAYQVNEPQAKAIISSMRTKGFSLIQGYVKHLFQIHCAKLKPGLDLLVPVRHGQYVV